ncbi:MAG: hypothetical protein IKY66_11650 [Bacteroidales bacterium]|nr:hypothetical protein [Bacteroidales bacterium]
MKKLALMLLLLLPLLANAQNEPLISHNDSTKTLFNNTGRFKSHINLEFAASANAYFTENRFDESSFKMNRVRLEIIGRLNGNLSYHFRQSFNKYSNPYAVDNMSSSIEYAYITWHHEDKFDLVAGKQYLAVGGYEAYVNGLKVREFSDFNNNFDIYQTGVMGVMKFSPTQHLVLQVANNRSTVDKDVYLYGLPEGIESSKLPILTTACWHGWFADSAVHLMYSASVGNLAKGKNLYYLMCGNVYEKGPILAYLDVIYARSALDNQQRITTLQNNMSVAPVTAQNVEYFTVIANMDYRFHPKWNGYLKGAYETAGVYEENGVFAAGRYTTSWNAQACLEWFPFTSDSGFKVFLHYLYKGYNLTEKANALGAVLPHTQRISLGIQYIIPVL